MAADFIEQLVVKRQEMWAEARKIPEKCAEEKREQTAEEQANWSQFNTDIAATDERIKEYRALDERAEQADELRSSFAGRITTTTTKAVLSDEKRLQTMGRVALGREQGSRMAEFGYSGGFIEARALAVGANGPSTVPVAFADFVAVYQRTLNPTYGIATVISSANGENLTIPRLTTDLTQYNPGEATAITESTPTISSVTLSVTSYKTLSYVSQELAQDEAVGLEGLIAKSAGRSIGLQFGTDITTGANGFIALGSNGGTGTAATSGTPFFIPTDVVKLFYTLQVPYRATASWQASNSALSQMRTFLASTGVFLWGPGLNGDQPDTFMGRPIYENPAMAAAASGAKSIAVGDFSAYYIKEVVPMRVESSTEFLFNLDQIAYKSVYRAGGTLPDVTAIRFLVCGAS